MVFFKYLENIVQYSSLNGYFHKDFENKKANVFHWSLPIFTVFTVISVRTHYNSDNYKIKLCALLILF